MTKVMICNNPKCGCQNLVRRAETQTLKDVVVTAALAQMDMWDGLIPTDYGAGMRVAVDALKNAQK